QEAMEKCLALPKKPKSGPLEDALEKASKGKNQFAAGVNVAAFNLGQFRNQLGPAAAKLGVFLDIKTAYATYAVKNDIDWEFGATFPDRDKAKEAEKTINDAIGSIRTALPLMAQNGQQGGKGGGQGQGGGVNDQMLAKAMKRLEDLKAKQSGKTVY